MSKFSLSKAVTLAAGLAVSGCATPQTKTQDSPLQPVERVVRNVCTTVPATLFRGAHEQCQKFDETRYAAPAVDTLSNSFLANANVVGAPLSAINTPTIEVTPLQALPLPLENTYEDTSEAAPQNARLSTHGMPVMAPSIY